MRDVLFAGLDVSTQSCKLLVLDWDSRSIIHIDTVVYDRDLPQYNTLNGVIRGEKPGVSESDPHMWRDAVELVLDRLKESPLLQNKIRCISVSGQQHGLVSLTAQGTLARGKSKLWNDFSTEAECRLLTEAVGGLDAMILEVGNSQRTGYTAAKILHMARYEPDVFSRTATLFLVHNYINWYLTGGIRVMEPGDTSGMALWHPATRQWSQKVIHAIDPSLFNKLPPVKHSDQSIGILSPELADRFGLAPGCVVDAGSGDNMYSAVGTGNVRPGIVTVSLGTSGTAFTQMTTPFIDPQGEIAAFCDSTGGYLPLLCVSNLANGYNALLKQHDLDHAAFDNLVRNTPPGNAGRVLVPWFMGERTPDLPRAAPVYFGFSLQDFTPEILARSVLEGHVLNLYEGFCRLPVKPEEIRLTGGLAQSEAWCQAIADIFAVEAVPVEGEGAALGAALHAAWVWLKENGQALNLEEVTDPFVIKTESRRKKPQPSARHIYGLQKRLFHALTQKCQGKLGEDAFALKHLMESETRSRFRSG